MASPVSPLAPAQFPDMPPVEGVRLATAAAGIRYPGRTDVLLALFEPGTAPGDWHEAAKAMMTTDTFPKGAASVLRLGAIPVTVCGIAKGAGMIAPDLATMLCFVFTDAPISASTLQRLLKDGVADTFNAL